MSAERWDKLEDTLTDIQDAIDALDRTPFGDMAKALDSIAEKVISARASAHILRP